MPDSASSEQPRKRAHYVQGTHWDREWYEPFQLYRARLVKTIDRLLDIMHQRDDFPSFFFDGQTSLIDDYLAIRPDNAEPLHALIRAGRIPIGPWFTMPDESLPSGEALVRNLLLGCRTANGLGVEPMRVGYVCDMFGHNSQLPQILCGFGIDSAVFFRGTNDETHPPRFRWFAPDGSHVMALKLPDAGGYGMCTAAVRIKPGLDHADEAAQAFIDLADAERRRTGLDDILLLDALDHRPAEERMVALLQQVRSMAPEWDVLWSTLEAFAADMRPHAVNWPQRQGELRDPAVSGGHVLNNVLSSRVPLKQANVRCQTLLEAWAEPLAVLTAPAGYDGGRPYLDLAWRYLLLNHAHDSICGCSLDQVHADMHYRFDQVRMIAETVRRDAAESVATRVAVDRPSGEAVVLVWNPLPVTREESVDLQLLLPENPDARRATHDQVDTRTFELLDADGHVVPYQLLHVAPATAHTWMDRRGDPRAEPRQPVRVSARLRLPACGYTTLVTRTLDTPRPAPGGSLSPATGVMDNGILRVTIRPNGAFDLKDLRSGDTYCGLGLLEDVADIGDGWNHFQPVTDEVVTSLAGGASVARLADGPEKVVYRITHRLMLPTHFDTATQARSTTRRDLEVATELTLRRGADSVQCETRVDNVIRDHALRLLLPTDLDVDAVLAETPFDVVERPAALRDVGLLQEPDQYAKPVTSFLGVHDGRRGLVVTTEGLHEAGLRDDERRTLIVTLCRAFPRNWNASVRDQVGGQLQQPLRLRWQVLPLTGPWDPAAVAMKARAATAGVYVHLSPEAADTPDLPPEQSLMEFADGRLTLTALKPAHDGDSVVLRVVNIADKPAGDRVRFARAVARFRRVTLEEKPAAEWAAPRDGWIPLKAGPKQILSIEIQWEA